MRREDPDRWLLADLAPTPQRPALWALAAFDAEVARIPARVREPMLGAIRRQWWREAWGELAAGAPRHQPVVEALAAAHAATPFDLAVVERLLAAREVEHDGPPADLAALVAWAAGTGGALAQLEATALGLPSAERAAAGHVGTAWGMLASLWALPQSLRQGRHHLPLDLLAANQVRIDRLNPRNPPAGLATVVDQVAKTAEVRLAAAHPPARLFRGYRRLALLYRDRLQRAGWNPFAAGLSAPTFGRAWRVLLVRVGF